MKIENENTKNMNIRKIRKHESNTKHAKIHENTKKYEYV